MKLLSKKTAALAAIISVAGTAAFLISCATVERVVVAPPMIPGATYVGMDTCAACHEKEVKNFKWTLHSRIQIGGERVPGQGCEACHGPGSLHVEAGGGKGKFIVNSKKSADACFQCHLDKRAEFKLPYHHPVVEGKVSCMDCHDPHGEDVNTPKKVGMGRGNDVCARCHREQAMPRVYEHEALREGCTSCHKAHGSVNPKMLAERDNSLCQKCHGQAHAAGGSDSNRAINIGKSNHNSRMSQATCWSAGCHHGVHGSNVDSHFRY